VFVGCVFYSLEGTLGGAIYLNGNVSIRSCRFANNTAENGDGNDVYVSISSSHYTDYTNIESTCSLSAYPGRLKTLDVYASFLLSLYIYICIKYICRVYMIICSLQTIVKMFSRVNSWKRRTPHIIPACDIVIWWWMAPNNRRVRRSVMTTELAMFTFYFYLFILFIFFCCCCC
jgi:hypothetical protein